jgi:hypothetical protein
VNADRLEGCVVMAEHTNDQPNVRELVRSGRLHHQYEQASPAERRRLRSEVYELLAGLVFMQLTRRMEARRGHRDCMESILRLRPDCMDRFSDDMDAVLDDLLRSAGKPIENLEGWVTRRLKAVTIDAYRRRRGDRGAMQRPRIPRWLAEELGQDERLMKLAVRMLEWAGVEASAGIHDWPFDVWSAQRIADGEDEPGANRSVADDVAAVAAAMRKRPKWYAKYVDTPMGRKPVPTDAGSHEGAGSVSELAQAAYAAESADDARRTQLAELALDLIQARVARGEDIDGVVVDVVELLFGSGSGSEELGRVPGRGASDDELVRARLADPATVDRIVATVLGLLSQ